jgi:hypothetical protein
MKRNKADFGLFIMGMLITAVSLDSSSFPGILIMLEVHNDEVFAQTSDDSTTNLEVSYTELGVLSGSFQRITYSSETRTLGLNNISASSSIADSGKILSSQQASQSQSNKQLSEIDERNLRDIITTSGFFQANSLYPPSTQNYTLHILGIVMDGETHTVLWTDTSTDVPVGLTSVAQAIENMASE